jgi:hypothetical protein
LNQRYKGKFDELRPNPPVLCYTDWIVGNVVSTSKKLSLSFWFNGTENLCKFVCLDYVGVSTYYSLGLHNNFILTLQKESTSAAHW